MARVTQLDMFGTPERPAVSSAADPDRVRRKLAAMLAEVRSAGDHGLPEMRRRGIQTLVPQMVKWLPDDEAEQIKREFAEALARQS